MTGAGSGIGAGTARAAFKAGDRVVATGRNLDKVRNALRDAVSENLAFVQLDVADEAQAKEVLVKIAAMAQPPKVFAAGSDALQVITPAVEARLAELRAHAELSRSTDFTSRAAPASKRLL